jgi:hypothetical protein
MTSLKQGQWMLVECHHLAKNVESVGFRLLRKVWLSLFPSFCLVHFMVILSIHSQRNYSLSWNTGLRWALVIKISYGYGISYGFSQNIRMPGWCNGFDSQSGQIKEWKTIQLVFDDWLARSGVIFLPVDCCFSYLVLGKFN